MSIQVLITPIMQSSYGASRHLTPVSKKIKVKAADGNQIGSHRLTQSPAPTPTAEHD